MAWRETARRERREEREGLLSPCILVRFRVTGEIRESSNVDERAAREP